MLNSRSFRQLMGCFATGVAVVSTRDPDGNNVGLTVNSVTSVSLEPPLVLFCIDRAAGLYPILKSTKFFSLNFLEEGQEDVSRYFANSHNPKPKNMWGKPQGDCPVLRQTLGWMACRKFAVHKAGDHDIIIGRVVKLHKRSGHHDPLLYFHGRYRQIKA